MEGTDGIVCERVQWTRAIKYGGRTADSQEGGSGTPGVLQKGNFAGLDRLCRLGKCDPLLAGGTGNLGNGDPGAGQ